MKPSDEERIRARTDLDADHLLLIKEIERQREFRDSDDRRAWTWLERSRSLLYPAGGMLNRIVRVVSEWKATKLVDAAKAAAKELDGLANLSLTPTVERKVAHLAKALRHAAAEVGEPLKQLGPALHDGREMADRIAYLEREEKRWVEALLVAYERGKQLGISLNESLSREVAELHERVRAAESSTHHGEIG